MFELENHITEAIEIALSSDLEDRFLADPIVDVDSFSSGAHQIGRTEQGELLRGVRVATTDHAQDVGDALLSFLERVKDLQPVGIPHHLEPMGDPLQDIVRGCRLRCS